MVEQTEDKEVSFAFLVPLRFGVRLEKTEIDSIMEPEEKTRLNKALQWKSHRPSEEELKSNRKKAGDYMKVCENNVFIDPYW